MIVAALQMNTQDNKEANVKTAEDLLDNAADKGAELAVLPELFNFLGPEKQKCAEAEEIPGPTTDRMISKAARHGMYIVAGSITETGPTPDKVYNTCVVIDPDGRIVGKYRKIHLFDIVVEGQKPYRESASVIPGEEAVIVDASPAKIGLTICYDLRFPELFCALSDRGAQIITVPAAFTLHTGMAHWETLIRARAIENTSYVIAAAQVGRHPVDRECYGNSMIVDPWGTVVARAPDTESVVAAEVDLEYEEKIRENLPSITHRRRDIRIVR